MAYNQYNGPPQGQQYYGNRRPARGPAPTPQQYDQHYDQGYDYSYDQGYNGYGGNDGYGHSDNAGYDDYNANGHVAGGYNEGQYAAQQSRRPPPQDPRPRMNGGGRGGPPPQQYPQGQYRSEPPRRGPPAQNFDNGGYGPNPGRYQGQQQPPPRQQQRLPPQGQGRPPPHQGREPLIRNVSPQSLPMDNPFPTFPTKKNAPRQPPPQNEPPTNAMGAMNINGGRPSMEQQRMGPMDMNGGRPSIDQQRMGPPPQSRGGMEPQAPVYDQLSAEPQQARNFSHPARQFAPPERSATTGPGMDDYGRRIQQVPTRPSTATGSRPLGQPQPGPQPQLGRMDQRYPPSAASAGMSQQAVQPPPARQQSVGDIYSDYYDEPDQGAVPTSVQPPQQQNAGFQAYTPSRSQESEIEARMPNFDAQSPPNNAVDPLNFDPQMDAARRVSPGPPRQDSQRQQGYPDANRQPDQYGGPQNQMYHQAQKARSQPNLRGGAAASYDDYGPVPGIPPGAGPDYGRQAGPGAGYRSAAPTPINTAIARGPNGPASATAQYGQASPVGYAMSPTSRSVNSQYPPNGPVQGQYPNQGAPNPNGLPPNPAPPKPVNPDALPAHPVPVRPGLMEQQSKPPPVRQYPPSVATMSTGLTASGTGSRRGSTEVASRRNSGPLSVEELEQLRLHVKANPSDNTTALHLAKSLVTAANHIGRDNPNMDQKQAQKMRERYNFDAHKIVKKLAGHNYPPAQFYLADCYGSGELGLPVDPKEAFPLYQSAAKLGHAAAAYRTAVCCELGADEGGGTRKDPLKAVQWYKRAAALGDTAAMYKMGMILLRGLLGQPANDMEALNWLKRAAEKADGDNPHALHELGLLYEAPRPNSRIIPDPQYAAELFLQAAKLGYKQSQARLGFMYEYGLLGKPVDARQSIIWYTRAAAQGEHESELALSGWYLTGSPGILEQSDTEAYLWARKAALANPPVVKALFALGYYSEVGIGCPRSLEEAKRWYGRAAAFKYPKAAERLDELRKNGAKGQRGRERLSRNNQKHREDCAVM